MYKIRYLTYILSTSRKLMIENRGINLWCHREITRDKMGSFLFLSTNINVINNTISHLHRYLNSSKAMHCSGRILYNNLIPPKPLPPPSASASPPIFQRRDIVSSSLLLLVAAPTPLRAETVNINNAPASTSTCPSPDPTKQAFLDISIDGEPVGRIIIGLYADAVPAGSARFIRLVSGAAGVSYRRKEFVKIMPNYVQHGGLRSYGVDAEMAGKTGGSMGADDLLREWERQSERCGGSTKNVGESVSIIVRDPLKPPPKTKLVARKGRLEIDEEEMGKDPNGTEFVISTRDSPELDESALVVGRVVEGMDVVERIGRVKTVQENTTSPYFRVAKLIGDKRAVVAERGFNRPYSKVVVTNCGLIG